MKKRKNFWSSGMHQMQSNNRLQPTRCPRGGAETFSRRFAPGECGAKPERPRSLRAGLGKRNMNQIEEHFYETAAQEVATKQVVPGLMAKAFSECDGDERRTIARYIKYRVAQLQ